MFKKRRCVTLILLVSFLVAACTPGGGPQIVAEEDEPNFRRGRQMERGGQNQIALEAFLRVIEKRGNEAPESHLEAGLIYLNHIKDPIAAIYHFRKHLELKPNSRQSRQVEDLQRRAERELAAKLPGRPFEAQLDAQDRIEKLTAENATLRAEIQRLVNERAGPAAAPAPARSVSRQEPAPVQPAGAVVPIEPAPVVAVAARERAAPSQPTAPAAPASRQTYVIQRGDTLWKISEKVYGNGRYWQEIFELNRDRVRSPSDLVVGMELRLP